MGSVLPTERIEKAIIVLRGQKVMLDSDLAELYEVETKALVRAMKRNIGRFPSDFIFQLSFQGFTDLRSQIGTSSWGGRRTLPYAFTEHGVAMLSSVLHSKKAVQVNIAIIRTFVRLREMALSHHDHARKIAALERKYDGQFQVVFQAIRELMEPPPAKKKNRIGF